MATVQGKGGVADPRECQEGEVTTEDGAGLRQTRSSQSVEERHHGLCFRRLSERDLGSQELQPAFAASSDSASTASHQGARRPRDGGQGKTSSPPQRNVSAEAEEFRYKGDYCAETEEFQFKGDYSTEAEEFRDKGGYPDEAEEFRVKGGYSTEPGEFRDKGGYPDEAEELRAKGGYSAEPEEFRERGRYFYWSRDDLCKERTFAEEPRENKRGMGRHFEEVTSPVVSPRKPPRLRNRNISNFLSPYPSSYDDSVVSTALGIADNREASSENIQHSDKTSRGSDFENCYDEIENAFSEQVSVRRRERTTTVAEDLRDERHLSMVSEERKRNIWRRGSTGNVSETGLYSEKGTTTREKLRQRREKIFGKYSEPLSTDEDCDECEVTLNQRTRISSKQSDSMVDVELKFNRRRYREHEDTSGRNSSADSHGKTHAHKDRAERSKSFSKRTVAAKHFSAHETTYTLDDSGEPLEQHEDIKHYLSAEEDQKSWNDNHSLLSEASAPLPQPSASDCKRDPEEEMEGDRNGRGHEAEVITTEAPRAKSWWNSWSPRQRGVDEDPQADPEPDQRDSGVDAGAARKQDKEECNSNATPFQDSVFRSSSGPSPHVLHEGRIDEKSTSQYSIVLQRDESDAGFLSVTDVSDAGPIPEKEAGGDSHLPRDSVPPDCRDDLSTVFPHSAENWSKHNEKRTHKQAEPSREGFPETTSPNEVHGRNVERTAGGKNAELLDETDRPANQTKRENTARHKAEKTTGSVPPLTGATKKSVPKRRVERSGVSFAERSGSFAERSGSYAARSRSPFAGHSRSSFPDRSGSSFPERSGSSIAERSRSSLAERSGSSLADRSRTSFAERSRSSLASLPKIAVEPSPCCVELVARELDGVEAGVGSVGNLQRWQRCMDRLFDVRRHSLALADTLDEYQQGTSAEDDTGSASSGLERPDWTQMSSRRYAADYDSSPVEIKVHIERDNSCTSVEDPSLLYGVKRLQDRSDSDSRLERDSESSTMASSGDDMANGSDDFRENSEEDVSWSRLLGEVNSRVSRSTSSVSYSYPAWSALHTRGLGLGYGGSSWQQENSYDSLAQSSSLSFSRYDAASSARQDDKWQLRWNTSPPVADEGDEESDDEKLWLRLPLSEMAGEADSGADGGQERPAFLPRTTSRLSKLIYSLPSNRELQRYCSRAPTSPRGRKRKSEEDLRVRESPPALRSILKSRSEDTWAQSRVPPGKPLSRAARKRLRFSEEADIYVYSCEMNLEDSSPDDQAGGQDRTEQEEGEDGVNSEMNRCESSLSSLSLLQGEAAGGHECEGAFMENQEMEDRSASRRPYSYNEGDAPRRGYGDDSTFARHASSIMSNLRSLAGGARSLDCSEQEPGTREQVLGDAALKSGSANLNNSSHYDRSRMEASTAPCKRRVTSARSGAGGLPANTAATRKRNSQSGKISCFSAHALALQSVRRRCRSSTKRSSHHTADAKVKDAGRRRQGACGQRRDRVKAACTRRSTDRRDRINVEQSPTIRQAPNRSNHFPEIDHLIFVEADSAAVETLSLHRLRRMEQYRQTFKRGGRFVNSLRWQNTSNNGNSDSAENRTAGVRRRAGARPEEGEVIPGRAARDAIRTAADAPEDLTRSFVGLSLREDQAAAARHLDGRFLDGTLVTSAWAARESESTAGPGPHRRDEGGLRPAPMAARHRVAQVARTASEGVAGPEVPGQQQEGGAMADIALLEQLPFPTEVTMQMVPAAVGDTLSDDIFIMDIESNLSAELALAEEDQRELEAGDQPPRTGDVVAPLQQDLDPTLVSLNTNNSHLPDPLTPHLALFKGDNWLLSLFKGDNSVLTFFNSDAGCPGHGPANDAGWVLLLLFCVSGIALVQLIYARFVLNVVRHLWEWEGRGVYSASDEDIDDIIDALGGSHPSESVLLRLIEATVVYVVVFLFFF